MTPVLLVIHVIVILAMIGVVLLQKSEGGGLGMGGGGMSGFMTGRSTANFLTRMTAGLAGAFMLTSILLGLIAANARAPRSIVDQVPPASTTAPSAPASAPASDGAPATPPAAPGSAPTAPAAPSVPLTR